MSLFAVNPGIVGVFIPIIFMLVGGAIAIAAILTNHQRQLRMNSPRESHAMESMAREIHTLRAELQALKDQVNEVTIAIDDTSALRKSMRQSPPPMPLDAVRHEVES